LREGKVVHAGATASVLTRHVLKDLYGVALTVMRRKGRYWAVVE
jgi:ABC-type enterochelin transport system ATPase subunit